MPGTMAAKGLPKAAKGLFGASAKGLPMAAKGLFGASVRVRGHLTQPLAMQ